MAYVRTKVLLCAQLPTLFVGVAIMGLLGVLAPERPMLLTIAYFAVCCAVGASMFGPEVGSSLLAHLLSQPVSRWQIWWERLGLTGLLLVPVAATFVSLKQSMDSALVVVVPVFALMVTPVLTLATRQGRIGFTGSLALGAIIYVGSSLLVPPIDQLVLFVLALGLVAGVFGALGFRQWGDLQDVNPLEQHLPTILGAAKERQTIARSYRPFPSLLKKEIFLQGNSLLLLAGLIMVGAMVPDPHQPPGANFALTISYCIPCLPLLVGLVSIAEEGRLAVQAENAILPVSRLRMWFLKLLVLLCLTVATATALLMLRHMIFQHAELVEDMIAGLPFLYGLGVFKPLSVNYAIYSVVLICIGMQAAQLSRGYPSALACLLLFFVAGLAMLYVSRMSWGADVPRGFGKLTLWPTLILGALWLLRTTCVNLNSTEPAGERLRWALGQLGLGMVLIALVQPVFAHRAWEIFEAKPLARDAVFQTNSAGFFRDLMTRNAGIGPERRFWVADFDNCHDGNGNLFRAPRLRVLQPESRWRDVAGGTWGCFAAIRNDGTLWTGRIGNLSFLDEHLPELRRELETIYPAKLDRFGNATNWLRITGRGKHLVALKTDGTLWQWGCNRDHAFGTTNRGEFISEPQQIGHTGDWKDICTHGAKNYALNADGRVFEWGRILVDDLVSDPRPSRHFTNVVVESFVDPAPALAVYARGRTLYQSSTGSSDWDQIEGYPAVPEAYDDYQSGILVLSRDGNLYSALRDHEDLIYRPQTKSGEWAGIFGNLGMKRDGSLWRLYIFRYPNRILPARWRPQYLGSLSLTDEEPKSLPPKE